MGAGATRVAALLGVVAALLVLPLGALPETAAASSTSQRAPLVAPVASFAFDFHLFENESADRDIGQYAARSRTSLNLFPVFFIVIAIGVVALWLFNR